MIDRVQPAGEPIDADDAVIEAALQEASVPTLIMSLIHMTGDTRFLDSDLRPQGIYLNEVQGFMSEEQQERVRAQALEVIKAYRDGCCRLPPPPGRETIGRMMSFLVAEDVPAEYVPMMLEEMELDGEDAREVAIDAAAADREAMHVLVIGAGMSGLLAAIRLQEAGILYTVVEKNAGVGGTWFENTYPGCRVDVGNHFYCYSFAPNHDWSQFFAKQPELQRYFSDCARQYAVEDNIRFNTEVTGAVYDEDRHLWSVRLRTPDGSEETVQARVLISAVGQLNRPKWPDIPGRERFKGVSLHSARWEPDLDLRGKRVAVIGTGASAFQLVPEIARDAQQVYVFQRSAPWMFPNPHYHNEVGEGKKWLLRHLPYYARWYRFLLFWPACDGLLPSLTIDPEWPHQDRSINEANEMIREVFTDYLRQQVGDDPELLSKVIPDYVPLAKRTLQDNGTWLAALKRDDVALVTDPIEALDESAVVCREGSRYEVDVVVYATGFHANRFLWPMEIIGRDGVSLREQWGDDPSAYLGITVPNFPNLFCCYGPGTNLAFGGSLIFNSECQVRYAMSGLKTMLEQGAEELEVRSEVHDAYDHKLQQRLSEMVWSHPSVKHSWYQNKSGRVTILSPWRLLDYWQWTRELDPADYYLR